MILRARVTRVILWSPRLEEEELDFFLFTSSGVQDYERALRLLKERPIAKENRLVRDFTLGLGSPGVERIRFIIERVDWEIIGMDHVAIAAKNARRWERIYRMFGAETECVTEDSNPGAPSSMKLWKVNWGNIRIALIEPISRGEVSQVEEFLRVHGDHSFQHIAIGVKNLKSFVFDMEKVGVNFLSPVLERRYDAFGELKQVFACVFDEGLGPTEGSFYEFVERPEKNEEAQGGEKIEEVLEEVAPEEFSIDAARMLFKQVASAKRAKDRRIFFASPVLFDDQDHGDVEQ